MNQTITLGTHLARLRKSNRFTQEDLADYLEVSRITIQNWESDRYVPNLKYQKKLADLYHISVGELMDPDLANSKNTSTPLKLIETYKVPYWPDTFLDILENTWEDRYDAWIWNYHYPYKRCIFSIPKTLTNIDDFKDALLDDISPYMEEYLGELEYLLPCENITGDAKAIRMIAAHEEFADSIYD